MNTFRKKIQKSRSEPPDTGAPVAPIADAGPLLAAAATGGPPAGPPLGSRQRLAQVFSREAYARRFGWPRAPDPAHDSAADSPAGGRASGDRLSTGRRSADSRSDGRRSGDRRSGDRQSRSRAGSRAASTETGTASFPTLSPTGSAANPAGPGRSPQRSVEFASGEDALRFSEPPELARTPSRSARPVLSFANLAGLTKIKSRASAGLARSTARSSEDSSQSAAAAHAHPHPPGAATRHGSGIMRPFPLLRSHSATSTLEPPISPAKPQFYDGPRRKTESDAWSPPRLPRKSDSAGSPAATGSSTPALTAVGGSLPGSITPLLGPVAPAFGAGALGPPGQVAGTPTLATGALAALSLSAAPRPEEKLELPPRAELTPEQYIDVLLNAGFGSQIGVLLAKQVDEFAQAALKAYTRRFFFVNQPADMALRRFLLYVRLPLETQQTERVLQSFSDVYHEQNPWVFADADQVYFVVFSMVILHTDTFNRNVRYKMTKADYVRSSYVEGVPPELFDYLYDNVTYTQFIHSDDLQLPQADHVQQDFAAATPHTAAEDSPTLGTDTNGLSYASTHGSSIALSSVTAVSVQSTAGTSGASVVGRRSASFGWSKDVDPYIPILEGTLDSLRPNLGPVLAMEDPFRPTYVDSVQQYVEIRKLFLSGPTIQLVSERSRPDAYHVEQIAAGLNRAGMSTESLLQITSPGVVDIKVVQVGVLLRREISKKMSFSRSTWREWGAILTESQLYLFKNAAWVKSIIESEQHSQGAITRTPMEGFSATMVLSTKDMVAMQTDQPQDQANAFVLVNRGGHQMWFAAESEEHMLNWMHVLNFAAAFSTYHVGPAPSAPTPPASSSAGSGSDENSPAASASPPGSLAAPRPGGFELARAATPPGKRGPLYRSASDTSLVSPHPGGQNLRMVAIAKQLREVERKIASIDGQIAEGLHTANHLRLLTPMQQRTRDALVFAAGQCASKCESAFLERSRLRIYRNMLEMDKVVEEGRAGFAGLPTPKPLETPVESPGPPRTPEPTGTAAVEPGPDSSFVRRNSEPFEVNGHTFSVVQLNPDLGQRTSEDSDLSDVYVDATSFLRGTAN